MSCILVDSHAALWTCFKLQVFLKDINFFPWLYTFLFLLFFSYYCYYFFFPVPLVSWIWTIFLSCPSGSLVEIFYFMKKEVFFPNSNGLEIFQKKAILSFKTYHLAFPQYYKQSNCSLYF